MSDWEFVFFAPFAIVFFAFVLMSLYGAGLTIADALGLIEMMEARDG